MSALLVNTVSVSPVTPRLRSSRSATPLVASARHWCRAEASGGGSDSGYRPGGIRGSWVSDYDLYELLDVERSSSQSEIKAAYRPLQKRCHPDVAGAVCGHDMAVVLNEVYALLFDPAARLAYDQEQAPRSKFAGYTGRPLYSSWLDTKSVYDRARAVAQWANDEDRIVDAINTCPVDCISMVERSDLAALEFLMSKQPRGRVHVSKGNVGFPFIQDGGRLKTKLTCGAHASAMGGREAAGVYRSFRMLCRPSQARCHVGMPIWHATSAKMTKI